MTQTKFTADDARRVLAAAREDIAMLLARQYEDIGDLHRALDLNTQMWRGALKEDPPEYSPRMLREVAR